MSSQLDIIKDYYRIWGEDINPETGLYFKELAISPIPLEDDIVDRTAISLGISQYSNLINIIIEIVLYIFTIL